jgi:multidrug resistance efflux pump
MKYFGKTGALLYVLLIGCNESQPTTQAVYRDVVEAVYASATVYAGDELSIVSMTDGRLELVMVQDGDKVNQGDLLFRLENDKQQAKLAAARKAVENAEKNAAANSAYRRELVAQKNALWARYENDSIQYNRLNNLWNQQIGKQQEVDRAYTSLQLSRADYQQLQTKLQRMDDQLTASLQDAKAQYTAALDEVKWVEIKATANGQIYDVYKLNGDFVRRGELLATLGSGDAASLQLKVDESDIRFIKPGQQLLVKLDIWPDTVLKAHITRIYSRLNKKEQAFRVDARFDTAF